MTYRRYRVAPALFHKALDQHVLLGGRLSHDIPASTLRAHAAQRHPVFRATQQPDEMSDQALRNALTEALRAVPGFAGIEAVFPATTTVVYRVEDPAAGGQAHAAGRTVHACTSLARSRSSSGNAFENACWLAYSARGGKARD